MWCSHFDLRTISPWWLLALAALCPACDNGPTDPIGKGQEAVSSRGCPTCHQSDDGSLSGQTVPQPHSDAYPANLTPDPDTGMGGWTDDLIVRAILQGTDDEDSPLCPPMPHFGTEGMSESEARNIVAYLRSLPPVAHTVPESSCPPLKTAGAPEGDAGGGDSGAAP